MNALPKSIEELKASEWHSFLTIGVDPLSMLGFFLRALDEMQPHIRMLAAIGRQSGGQLAICASPGDEGLHVVAAFDGQQVLCATDVTQDEACRDAARERLAECEKRIAKAVTSARRILEDHGAGGLSPEDLDRAAPTREERELLTAALWAARGPVVTIAMKTRKARIGGFKDPPSAAVTRNPSWYANCSVVARLADGRWRIQTSDSSLTGGELWEVTVQCSTDVAAARLRLALAFECQFRLYGRIAESLRNRERSIVAAEIEFGNDLGARVSDALRRAQLSLFE